MRFPFSFIPVAFGFFFFLPEESNSQIPKEKEQEWKKIMSQFDTTGLILTVKTPFRVVRKKQNLATSHLIFQDGKIIDSQDPRLNAIKDIDQEYRLLKDSFWPN